MRFLLVAGYPDSLLNFRGALIDALQKKGFSVHVAAPGLCNGSGVHQKLVARSVIVHDVPMNRTGLNPLGDLRTLIALFKLMLVVKPNIVLSYTIKPVVYGGIAAWLARIPNRFALITGLGYAFQGGAERNLARRIATVLYRVTLRRMSRVIFQNSDDRELFHRLGLVKLNYSGVVNGSGVDTKKFSETPILRGQVKFLLIARLLGDKGVREYVAAGLRIKKLNPGVTIALVGPLDTNPNAIGIDEVRQWVGEGLDYMGALEDVRPAIAECTVYVLPSYREGTPRSVLEAMAMGRAIITTDAPGCRETVVDGDNGFLVAVKSVDELENAMGRFIREPELAYKMGRKSRDIAVSKYDVDSVNAAMMAEMDII